MTHAPFWRYWSSHGLESDGRSGTSLAEDVHLSADSLVVHEYPPSVPPKGAAVITLSTASHDGHRIDAPLE